MMLANDVLRRLRYAFALDDRAVLDLLAEGGSATEPDELAKLLRREDEPGFLEMRSGQLDAFLDGLIAWKRGKREPAPGAAPPPRVPLTNNGILRKLRIALSFREEDMLATLELARFRISRGELSAFFRQRGHKNYREAGDQVVRNFLAGLTVHLRGTGD